MSLNPIIRSDSARIWFTISFLLKKKIVVFGTLVVRRIKSSSQIPEILNVTVTMLELVKDEVFSKFLTFHIKSTRLG